MTFETPSLLRGETHIVRFDAFVLDTGAVLTPIEAAYQTLGRLNVDKTNGILICHAVTGDAQAAGVSAEDGQLGWWDNMIGPGKAFDIEKCFVICTNVLGGCRSTTDPSTIDPKTGQPYVRRFPGLRCRSWCVCRRLSLSLWELRSCWRFPAGVRAAC